MPSGDGSTPEQPESLLQRLAQLASRFADAATLRDAAERLATTEREAAEVRSWLASLGIDAPAAAADARSHPAAIGPYHILDVLGQGGMGVVYLAEQLEPVRRRVAIKLVKLGMDTRAVVARFEQERQALALMQHDGIAKVYDCGATERGQPYFVMEVVEGVPIHDYCEHHRLSVPDRIALLQQVCAAVTHAHQKGVVHRDLKPGNVLVHGAGGKPQVKVIDFGLAKAIGEKLVEASLFTEAGRVVGTPEYMAPEQADPTNRDIDTRADVYSLGVMLYELLVGSLPFASATLRGGGLGDFQRVLREQEPPRPSARFSSDQASSTTIAAARQTTPSALQRQLRTDLDWVVLKAIEKDRDRRYESAGALADDLQRYLDHEPLVSGPPSANYRLRKFLSRYRPQAIAAAAILLAIVVGGIGTAVGFATASARAEENGRLAEANGELARVKGELAASLDTKVAEFDQLKAMVLFDRAIASQAELYPPWPAKIPAMQDWLTATDALLGMRSTIQQTIADLRMRARPSTPEAIEASRRAHPEFAEWELLSKQVASLRHAQAIRDGSPEATGSLDDAQQFADVKTLRSWAFDRVAPGLHERKVWGEETLGLAAARAAAQRNADGSLTHLVLALALMANGHPEEAELTCKTALRLATSDEEMTHIAMQLRAIQEARIHPDAALDEATSRLAELTDDIRAWDFEVDSQKFLHDTLAPLPRRLASLEAGQRAGVLRRLRWAQHITDLTLQHPNCRHSWTEVRLDISKSPEYAGQTIRLRDEDVLGLVPIGKNPATRLWEFYELASAWNGEVDPATIPVPRHDADGSMEMTPGTGIVFVLLPGGSVVLGAQRSDPSGPNYDPSARDNETPHSVELRPFFLARHEMTREQWLRLAGTAPFWWRGGIPYDGDPIVISPTHPADSMSWEDANRWMERNGLQLPTEAQWEYACRAGTRTVWWSGDDPASLEDCANIHDQTSFARRPDYGEPGPGTDGFTAIAPVGTFRANAFGLYDMHGNVWEWCRDWTGEYGNERVGDGLRSATRTSNRVLRGGSCNCPPRLTRSSYRNGSAPTTQSDNLGLRPARICPP